MKDHFRGWESKDVLAVDAVSRAQTGFGFVERCLDYYPHGTLRAEATSPPYSRQINILIAYNFELILNSFMFMESQKSTENDLINEAKVGHKLDVLWSKIKDYGTEDLFGIKDIIQEKEKVIVNKIYVNMKNDEELKKDNPELYQVARAGGTEAPFIGKYVNTKDEGVYHCAVCDVPLFSSDTKFDSKSGWPSFTDPVNLEVVTLHEDDNHEELRTEVRCKNCNSHLGHVFPDGPKKEAKTCDRYCINSVSLNLKKDE